MMKNYSSFGLLIAVLSVCCMVRAAEIKQNRPNSLIDGAALNKPHRNVPDERILWQLLHAKKYQQLTRQIEHLKQQYPEWLPPNDLINALHDRKNATSKSTAKTTHSNRKKATNYHDPCPNLLSRWSNAEAYLTSNRPAKAVAIYDRIIAQCPAKNRMQTLEKARSRLVYSDFIRLLQLSSHYLPPSYLDRLKYDALKDRILSNKPLNPEEHERAVTEISGLLQLFKDDSLATVIGWRYFDMNDYKKAQDWFQKAVFWNPSNENASYGQLLSLEKAGDYDQALATYLAISKKKTSTQTQEVAARIFKAKAWQNFARNRLSQAAENASLAQKITGLDTEIQELNAWIANQTGQYANAAKGFDELYLQSPGRKYARAYIQNQAQVDRSLLSRKAGQAGGVLLDEYNQFHGQELYDRKQFQSTYKLAPNTFPKLEGIDSPSVDVGGYVRYKSGEDGLGRLDLFKAPIATGSYTVDGNNNFKLDLSRVQLYSGSPGKCASSIGILPFNLLEIAENPGIIPYAKQLFSGIGESPNIGPNAKQILLGAVQSLNALEQNPYSQNIQNATKSALQNICTNSNEFLTFSPTEQLKNAFEIDFSYHKDGWFSPFVKIGSTPVGGIIAPTVTFDVGFLQQTGFGNWGLQVYSQPVRQSILSYTGIKDPYIGQGFAGLRGNPLLQEFLDIMGASVSEVADGLEWGRVLRTGFKSSIFYRFNDNWNTSGAVDLALLEGKNVKQNTAISASASLSRNFRISGFDYFNVGPSINYEHYNKNLSHFTYGHGGYFSPEHYYNIGAGINFLTEEGQSFVIRGRLTAGFQGFKESAAPWFPLGNNAAGNYAATHQSGEAFDFELKGVWLISPNFQLGAGGAIRKTSGYEDYTGGLFARYYFDGRKASFSTDIQANMFSSMY